MNSDRRRRDVLIDVLFKLIVFGAMAIALLVSLTAMFMGGLHSGFSVLMLFSPILVFGGGFIAYWVDDYRWNRRQVSPDSSTAYKTQETPETV